ncbi:hypothetical protein FN976_24400 [Caenimonas sedimenti]|uniref:PIN domain-containing protein n=1 Tax=Caenimonas sedimenti TaxID=2596921 RepID=A0A562ZI49_9BURK|nr:hypothetical protein [Caenimonas sedimenti]TWO68081.1 hypothetical protein FN976_24400 [Caenimonas sedimenti]
MATDSTKESRDGKRGRKRAAVLPGQKQVAPSAASGGAGDAFQNRVQAHRLLAMCLGLTTCPGIPEGFRIVGLRFQARVFGTNTDDLVCAIADPYGNSGRVLLQIKRSIAPSSKNAAFREAVGLAWLDYNDLTFRRDFDSINIVYDVDSQSPMRPMADLQRDAVRSSSGEAWLTKATADHFSNDGRRSALAAIQAVVNEFNGSPVAPQDLLGFLQRVEFVSQDLDHDDTAQAKTNQQWLEFASRAGGRPTLPGKMVWARLVTACVELNARSGEVDAAAVPMILDHDLDYRFKAFALSQFPSSSSFVAASATVTPAPEIPSAAAANRLALASPAPSAISQPGASTGGADLIPVANESSSNKFLSRHLDRINDQIKAFQFEDALAALKAMREDLGDETLDLHQDARWYLMRATCVWTLHDDDEAAAQDFLRAADLYADDDKLAAARVRGLMLLKKVPEALEAARQAQDRFPDSLAVWTSLANARILAGERVTDEDIPVALRTKSAAYQLAAAGLHQSGDLTNAYRVSLLALQQTDASFFVRETVLRYALELATKSPLHVAYRIADQASLQALEQACSEFEPRSERLWAVQDPGLVVIAATHLAMALILLGRPEEALLVTEEAQARGLKREPLLRPRLDALRALRRPAEALEYGRSHLATMPIDALVSYAQIAAAHMDEASLLAAISAGITRQDEAQNGRLPDVLKAMKWDLMIDQGRFADVASEARGDAVLQSQEVALIIMAARAMTAAKDPAAQVFVARAEQLADQSGEERDEYLVAQMLMQMRKYEQASRRYERFLPRGVFSDLHTNLLSCYFRLGQRRKARDLLASFPDDWVNDPTARHIAIDLANQAGDSALLASLVEPQIRAEPQAARSWLLAMMSAARLSAAFPDTVARIPEIVSGSFREIAQIASMEFRQGQVTRGLRRLYRMRRTNLGSTDAAAAYNMAILLAPPLEEFEYSPEVVDAGTGVQFVGPDGTLSWKTIDPAGFDDLPGTDEFIHAGSPEAKALLGRRLGEEFDVRDGLGEVHRFKVVQLDTSHRRLLGQAGDAIRSPLAPSKHITRIELAETEDGGLDLTTLTRQVTSKAQRAERLLGVYDKQPVTLGMLARVLGIDVIDVVRGWPHDGPLLQVGGATQQERAAVVEALKTEQALLIDVTALTELALVQQLELLRTVPRALVTGATRSVVLAKITELRSVHTAGMAVAHEGKLGMVEISPEARARELSLLGGMLAAIDNHCEVLPAYGPERPPAFLAELARAVSHEEHAVLLVALEHGVRLFSLDNRLRAAAATMGVQGCWPQAFLQSRLLHGLMPREYSVAVLKMFASRRNFISLGAADLIVLVDQGAQWADVGLNALRAHLADPILNFEQAWKVVSEFLTQLYRRGNCQVGVVLELYSYLLEGLLRHPHRPKDFREQTVAELAASLEEVGGSGQHYAPIIGTFAGYAARAMQTRLRPVSLKARVVYCSSPPTMLHGLLHGDDPITTAASRATPASPSSLAAPSTTLDAPIEAD